MSSKYDYIFKILLLGGNVGKTSLLSIYFGGHFIPNHLLQLE